MRGIESAPPRLTLFREGPPNLTVAAPCFVQHAPMALSQEVCEKIEADFSLTDQALRPKSKKITSGRPDDKHDLQAPTSYKIRSLANHFAKSTKYMT
jgi:hypothetical protein